MTDEYDDVRGRMNDGRLYIDFGPGLEALEAERVAGISIGNHVMFAVGVPCRVLRPVDEVPA